MQTPPPDYPVVAASAPLPLAVWLIIAGLALLSIAGVGLWAALLAAGQLADPTWLFLCR
jgi:hypothetical protein